MQLTNNAFTRFDQCDNNAENHYMLLPLMHGRSFVPCQLSSVVGEIYIYILVLHENIIITRKNINSYCSNYIVFIIHLLLDNKLITFNFSLKSWIWHSLLVCMTFPLMETVQFFFLILYIEKKNGRETTINYCVLLL